MHSGRSEASGAFSTLGIIMFTYIYIHTQRFAHIHTRHMYTYTYVYMYIYTPSPESLAAEGPAALKPAGSAKPKRRNRQGQHVNIKSTQICHGPLPDPLEDPKSRSPKSGFQYSYGVDSGTLR